MTSLSDAHCILNELSFKIAFHETVGRQEKVSRKLPRFHCDLASHLLVLKRQLAPPAARLVEPRGKMGGCLSSQVLVRNKKVSLLSGSQFVRNAAAFPRNECEATYNMFYALFAYRGTE